MHTGYLKVKITRSKSRRITSNGSLTYIFQTLRNYLLNKYEIKVTQFQSYYFQIPRFFENSVDDDSSRASTPDEMTPSLAQRGPFPVRQDLCVSCIAKAAAAITHQNNINDKAESSSVAEDTSRVLPKNQDLEKSSKMIT